MHQDAAGRVVANRPVAIGTGDALARDAHGTDITAFETELGRVVQYENRAAGRREPLTCGLEMSGQDLAFTDAIIVEKLIGRFGVGPVLAHQRDACARTRGQLLEQGSKSLAKALIVERTPSEFAIKPIIIRIGIGNTLPLARSNLFARHVAPRVTRTRNSGISCCRSRCKINL